MRFPIAPASALLVSAVLSAAPVVDSGTIRLDVIVTDLKDRPIQDLKLADFEISDAGEMRTVDAVARHAGGSGRLVAIFLDEYHVQAGESTDRARAALARFIDDDLRPDDEVAIMKPLDPLNSIKLLRVAEDRQTLQAEIEGFGGRKGNYTPTTPFERNFMSRASGPADASRTQIVSSALQSLAIRIGAVREGRKSVILISEGFSPSLSRGSDRLMGSLRAIVYAANRYGVAIYPVDPRAAAGADDAPVDQATLKNLAEQTGGQPAFSHGDLMPALKQAAMDLDDYYMLTYRAARAGDGQFHPVQLRVNRANAQVRLRSGYWSADADLLKPAAAAVSRADAVPFRPPHTSALIRQWVGTSRGRDDLTNVTVAWEPGAAPPRNQHIGSVELKVISDDGRVLFDAPLLARGTFAAAPGLVHVEMTIRGIDGKTLDSDYRAMQVPNLRAERLTFASLQVMRTRSAREFLETSVNPTPAPAASRDFSRAERLLLRVPVYTPGDTPPTVTATLLNRTGAPMRELKRVTSDLPAEIVQFDLPLSSLAPEDYRVEIAALDGGEQAKTVLLFRVTN